MECVDWSFCTTSELEFLHATVGISEEISHDMFEEIQSNAKKIMSKAIDEFEKYLDSRNLELCMGLIVPRITNKAFILFRRKNSYEM